MVNIPASPAPLQPASLLRQLEQLREQHGTLTIVELLAQLEDREAMNARRRHERGTAELAGLLARGLRAFGPQLAQAAAREGIAGPRPPREDADHQAWAGHRDRPRRAR